MSNNNVFLVRLWQSLLTTLMQEEAQTLTKAGIAPEALEILMSMRTLPHTTLEKAHHYLQLFLRIEVDTTGLKRTLTRLMESNTELELQNELILKGAPYQMLKHYWGIGTQDFSYRRKQLLGGHRSKGGRIPLPSKEVENSIWDLWKRFETLTEVERYLKVHEMTGESLETIWVCIARYNEWHCDAIHSR